MKRQAISQVLILLVIIFFTFGAVWTTLYYAIMLPLESSVTGIFGNNIFDPNTKLIMDTAGAWWPEIVGLSLLMWLWQASNKRGLTY